MASSLREMALKQLLYRLKHLLNCNTPDKLWGDEVEYMVVKFLASQREVKVLLRAQEAREELTNGPNAENLIAIWSPEMSRFQAETAPRQPFTPPLDALLDFYANLRARRREFKTVLRQQGSNIDDHDEEEILSLSLFPLSCAPRYTFPECQTDMNSNTSSKYYPYASIMYPHQEVVSNRKVFLNTALVSQDRRKAATYYYVPMFRDEQTPTKFMEDLSAYQVDNASLQKVQAKLKPNEILIDSAGFGLSACSVQLTQQATNLAEATYLYDQLSVLCPIMMAVTAASPIIRGYLSTWDNRWLNFCNSWEDRTPEERGDVPGVKQSERMDLYRIYSIETYLSEDTEQFNDVHVKHDPEICRILLEKGVPPNFSRYVAHLMVHSPVAVTDLTLANETETTFGMFTSIQDFTNWSIMRLKFPILDENDLNKTEAGFRVEFRVMDLQPTSFENAAFVTFIRLISLALLHFRLDLRIPITKLFENVLRGVQIDACRNAVFHWRCGNAHDDAGCATTTVNGGDNKVNGNHLITNGTSEEHAPHSDEAYNELSINQIFIGSTEFIGLIPLVNNYLHLQKKNSMSTQTMEFISQCMKFVESRVIGVIPTRAQWVREFIKKHPSYKHDSVVPQNVVYDLLRQWQAEANAADGIN